MNGKGWGMAIHIFRMVGVCAVTLLVIFLPFFPGNFDGLALLLSTTAQLLSLAALVPAPIALVWLIAELLLRRSSSRAGSRRGYYFAWIVLAVASLLLAAVVLIVLLGVSLALGIVMLAVGMRLLAAGVAQVRQLKTAERSALHPLPVYLTVVPLVVLLFQVALAAPVTAFSRNYAIANSVEFIEQIEAYHTAHGHYPLTLAAVWKDYSPAVVGIESYHYAPHADAYNLFFEQPKLIIDNFGAREWVVYNPKDEHRIHSHTSWFLLLTPEELDRSQGWYAVHDAGAPHWKYFWFD
jgi:hypothetical protein